MSVEHAAEWGPWFWHDGAGCPPDLVGKFVHLWFEPDPSSPLDDGAPHELIGILTPLLASCASWDGAVYWGKGYVASWGDMTRGMKFVSRYRMRKPRALIELIELVETLPTPERLPEVESA